MQPRGASRQLLHWSYPPSLGVNLPSPDQCVLLHDEAFFEAIAREANRRAWVYLPLLVVYGIQTCTCDVIILPLQLEDRNGYYLSPFLSPLVYMFNLPYKHSSSKYTKSLYVEDIRRGIEKNLHINLSLVT